MRVGVEATSRLTSPLVHTATVYAIETDKDYSNNISVFTSSVSAVGPPIMVEIEVPESVTYLTPTTDIVLQASAPSTVVAGLPFTYIYTITNVGTADATNVRFENTVPPATTLNEFAPGLGDCEWQENSITCRMSDLTTGNSITITLVATGYSGQTLLMWLDPLMPGWPMCYLLKERDYLHIVTCELGRLRTGQSTNVRVGFTATGIQERLMLNAASVSTYETETNSLNNSSTTTITVLARADLAVRSNLAGRVPGGEVLSYTLTATNFGPSDAANVLLTDTMPMGTSLESARPSLGIDCALESEDAELGVLICRAGHLDSGETATVTITIAVGDLLVLESAEPMVHSARVTADQVDPDPGNNELIELISVSDGETD